jgi:CRP-like cAMP-binding protein
MSPITPQNFRLRFPSLASPLADEEIEKLIEAFAEQELAAGEAMIIENTYSDILFLVWDGTLNVTVNTSRGEQEIAVLGAGSYLGEISLMDPGPSTATVRTQQGCMALHMHREALEAFWEQEPRIATIFLQEMSRAVSQRIRATVARLNTILAEGMQDVPVNTLTSASNTLYTGKQSA